MSEADQQQPRPSAALRAGGLGLAVLAGWLVVELGAFLAGGEPRLVLRSLAPAYLAWAAGLFLLGAAAARWPVVLPIFVGVSLCAVLEAVVSDRPTLHRWLPRVLFLMGVSLWIVLRAPRPGRLESVHLALLLGGAACYAAMEYRGDVRPFLHGLLPLAVAVSLVALLLPQRGHRLLWLAVLLLLAGGRMLHVATVRAGLGKARLAPVAAPSGSAPSLLLVVIDTLRADHLGCYGSARDTTPRLDAFAREDATLYEAARSTGPFTLSSHGSLFTGLYPAEHGALVGAHASQALRPEAETLAERLRAAGYQTSAVFANRLYLNPRLGFDRGFEDFDLGPVPSIGAHLALPQLLGQHVDLGHVGKRADIVTDRALRWLRERRRDQPFFLALNYIDVHAPYLPPEATEDLFGFEGPRDVLLPVDEERPVQYDRCLRSVDGELGRLFDALRARGSFEDTLVVVTSDHGEAFGQRGIPEHCWNLHEELLRVPLLVKPPGGRRRARAPEPITGAEVHDLILAELGLAARPSPLAGPRPLGLLGEWAPWPLLEENRVFARKLGRDLEARWIAWLRDGIKTHVSDRGEVLAYDLAADPGELLPLELDDEARATALAEARAWWARHPADDAHPQVSGEDRRALRALGYGG